MVPVLTGRSYTRHVMAMVLGNMVPANYDAEVLGPQVDSDTPAWYALHTCSRHERRVASQLSLRSLEFFLPLYRSMRRWNDRSKLLELPLFPGYIFVHIALKDRLRVLSIGGTVGLVGPGKPKALQDGEIQQIRQLLLVKNLEPYPYMRVGSYVRVARGPLEGTEGYVLRCKNSCRVVISLHLIQRSVAVEVDAKDLMLVPGAVSVGEAPSALRYAPV